MRPDDPQMKHPSIFVPQRPQAPHSSDTRGTQPAHQQAAADIARTQIDSIYQNDPNSTTEVENTPEATPEPTIPQQPAVTQTTTQPADQSPQIIIDRKQQYHQKIPEQTQTGGAENPYTRTHDESKLHANANNWDEYHSAWQKYYQEYFQRYYAGHVQQTQAAFNEQNERIKQLESRTVEQTPEQAMDDLRSQLRSRIKERSTKVRKSRHFMPIMAAVAVMFVFVFLQYNRVIFAYANAYVSPGAINPDNIIVNPSENLKVSQESRLIIPKINVDVPVIYENTMGRNQQETYDKQMAAMEEGVAWFGIDGADSRPGQKGNTVLSGHSSNDWFDMGDLKFVFANLDRLKKDDTIYANYEGTRYTYRVTDTTIVLPTELDALQIGTGKAMLTLITCTPLGTSEKRLLIYAEQVSPDPDAAKAAPIQKPDATPTEIPGVKSSLLGGLFG